MTDHITVTSQQLIHLAGNANDQRVVTEAREFAERHGVNGDLVQSMTCIPPQPPRQYPRIVFVCQVRDDDGERGLVKNESTGQLSYAMHTTEVKLVGELPTWWAQAARLVVEPAEA